MKIKQFTLILAVATALLAQPDVQLQRAMRMETLDGNLKGAIAQYEALARSSDRTVAAKALVRMGLCYEKLGSAEARKAYERALREFPGETESAATARARLIALNGLEGLPPSGSFAAIRLMAERAASLGPVSRDGRWLPWIDWEHGDLGLRDMKSGEVRRLTNDRSGWVHYAGSTVLSPDNSRVAFSWAGPSDSAIQVMNADGTGRMTLVPALGSGIALGPVGWLPDGKSIVAASVNMARQEVRIGIVNAATRETAWHEPLKLIPRPGGGGAITSLSANGRYLLLCGSSQMTARARDVFVYDLQRRKLDFVVDDPADDTSPAWSPDGGTIYFVSDRHGSGDIYAVSFKDGAASGEPRLLHSVAGRIKLFGTSANGTLIALEESQISELHSLSLAPVADSETARAKRLQTRVAHGNSNPAWSPDGRTLAFLRTRENMPAVIVMRNTDTQEEREFAPAFPALNLTWHPDSRRLLLTGSAADGMAMLDAGSGGLSKVAIPAGAMAPLARIGYAAFSPDGTEIYYGARSGSDYALMALNPVNAQSRKVNGPSQRIMYRVNCFSPDGKWFLFYQGTLDTNHKSLMIRPASGGEARELVRGKNIWLGQAVFTPDSKDVIVGGTFTHLGDTKPGFWRIPVEGGKPRKIHELAQIVSFSIHPGGREIVFGGMTEVRNLWAFPTIPLSAK